MDLLTRCATYLILPGNYIKPWPAEHSLVRRMSGGGGGGGVVQGVRPPLLAQNIHLFCPRRVHIWCAPGRASPSRPPPPAENPGQAPVSGYSHQLSIF